MANTGCVKPLVEVSDEANVAMLAVGSPCGGLVGEQPVDHDVVATIKVETGMRGVFKQRVYKKQAIGH